MNHSVVYSFIVCAAFIPAQSMASSQEIRVGEDKAYAIANRGEVPASVEHIQDTGNALDGSFTKTSRPCPPFCVNPLKIEQAVATVAEVEVIKFTETALHSGKGVLVDARPPGWYQKGTIPGSTNIPYSVFEKPADDPELAAVLESLGVSPRDDVNVLVRSLEKIGFLGGDDKTDNWDFSKAKTLLIWCNGPWCGQSPRAIRALIGLGYPADKLYYYRGGMQMWQSLGLNTVIPTDLSTYASN